MNPNETDSAEDLAIPYVEAPVAYLRPVETSQGKGFAVCTADGSELAVFATREAAMFAARQHELEPVMLH